MPQIRTETTISDHALDVSARPVAGGVSMVSVKRSKAGLSGVPVRAATSTALPEAPDAARYVALPWLTDTASPPCVQGASSLNLLKDYEFDVLKVDMEFLRGMEDAHRAKRSKTIVLSIIAMAHELGITTLVEGVETED